MGFYLCVFFFTFNVYYLCINNAPIFTSWITKLSQRISRYFNLFNTLKEVHIHTTHNQPSQNVPQPAACHDIAAANFTLVRLPFRTRFGLCCLLLSPAFLPIENILTGLICVRLGYMSEPAILKEINEL